MWRNIGLWILALVITLAAAVYQMKTGPTYPVSGVIKMKDGGEISYTLLRSHGGPGDQPVAITATDTTVTGVLVYRRYKSLDDWKRVPMVRAGDQLMASLPHQPPAGKIEYHIELKKDNSTILIPEDENIVTRFKGNVPSSVLIPHIIFMFVAMLVSTRTGLEALRKSEHIKTFAFWTTGLLIVGGLIFGPIVQKFAFGAYWTGIPFGTDLTDNKTLIAFVAWLIAIIALLKSRRARGWVLLASVVTLLIFMIPHSMHGSELDYAKIEKQTQEAR